MNKLIVFLVLFIFSNGCAMSPTQPVQGRVISNVTSFHNITGTITKRTIKVLPFDKSLESSLQFQNYATTIASYLKQSGFSVAVENQTPDYVVFVSYGIGSGKTIAESTPVFGQTGGGTTTSSGTVYGLGGGSSYYSGSSYTMPTFGVVGSRTSTSTVFTRNLAIDIVDTSSLKSEKPIKIYEGRVKSIGKCGGVNYVMSEMIESMFRNFPGTSGNSRKVEIPSNAYFDC
jgi:hypothetical protein